MVGEARAEGNGLEAIAFVIQLGFHDISHEVGVLQLLVLGPESAR